MSNHGVNRLALAFQNHFGQPKGQFDALELATIGADGSLRLDHFAEPIPAGEYLIDRALTLPDPMVTITVDGNLVDIPRPEELAPPAPGDRVLVGWVNRGRDPIVLKVVVRHA